MNNSNYQVNSSYNLNLEMGNSTCEKLNYSNCHTFALLFEEWFFDLTILKVAYIYLPLIIIVTNSLLIYKLRNKEHLTRPDKLFLIISISDIFVGFASVMVSLPLYQLNINILCKIFPAFFVLCMVPLFIFIANGFDNLCRQMFNDNTWQCLW